MSLFLTPWCCHSFWHHGLQEVPQALRNNPADVFGSRVAALRQLGIVDADLQSVVSRSTLFLTTKDAPHEQIAFLKDELGYSMEQVRMKQW
jgi:hypothetical protein